jgi:anaerobic ribonucleoside-triphosphate reductase
MVQTLVGKHTITLQDEERQECEIWTRVMGYYRPVSEFNIGKKSEHNERIFFKESKTINAL